MAVTAYFQPTFQLNHLRWSSAARTASPYAVDLSDVATVNLKVGLIATGTLNATRSTTAAYEFVADLLANSGSALTEEAGTNYARQVLASVTWTRAALVDTLTCANPSWTTATISSKYAFFYAEGGGTDATRPLIAIWDFGGTVSVVAGTYTLQIAGTGLVTWTAAV